MSTPSRILSNVSVGYSPTSKISPAWITVFASLSRFLRNAAATARPSFEDPIKMVGLIILSSTPRSSLYKNNPSNQIVFLGFCNQHVNQFTGNRREALGRVIDQHTSVNIGRLSFHSALPEQIAFV